jgi:glycerol-3-phosphate dehydrogenase (NAD(P)+)
MTSLNDLSRNRTLGLLIGKGFFSTDYKSNSVILEGLNAIEMFHDLIDEKSNKDLLIFNKLYSFFANQEKELEFKFNELVN